MRRNNFFVKAMIVCIMPLALLSCGNDEGSGPAGEPENGIKGLATVNALSVSVSGSFGGVSKIDLSLGKTGILYCLKSDTAASVFEAWLGGNKKAACYEYTDGKLTSDTYAGTITNLYPDNDYNFCLFSVGRDGKTVKMSDIYTFHTKKLEPEFRNVRSDSIRYTKFVVKGRVLNINTNDASSCNTGLLLTENENGEVKASSKTYEVKGVKSDMRILANELTSDSNYCCRPYIKYVTHDDQVHYIYGPAVAIKTNNMDDWAIDLGLSVRWSQCEGGREDFDDIYEYLFDNSFYVCWGSLVNYYAAPKNYKYEYWDEGNQSYIDIGNEISGTQYDVAHAMLGGHWRLPTKAEVEELISNTRITYSETEYEIPYSSGGMLRLTANLAVITAENGNSIKSFIGSSYWTGTMSDEANYPYLMRFNKERTPMLYLDNPYTRDDWWQIRPVWDPDLVE